MVQAGSLLRPPLRCLGHSSSIGYPEWHSLLRQLLIEYVTLLTNPEGTSPSAPSLKRQECLERDKASEEARAATATAAGGGGGGDVGGGDGDGGGDGGGDGDSDGDGDEDEDDDGSGLGEEEAVASKPAASKAKGKGAGKPWKKKKSLLWTTFSPGTIARVVRAIKHS